MIAIIGLLFGIILGVVFDVNIPERFSPYMSVAILACLDSVFGAVRANLSKKLSSRYIYIRIFRKCSVGSSFSLFGG